MKWESPVLACKNQFNFLSSTKSWFMKLLLLVILLAGGLIVNYAYTPADAKITKRVYALATDSVYVCNSTTSVAYHSSSTCRGLNRCTHKIVKVTKKEAVETYGKRACKICF